MTTIRHGGPSGLRIGLRSAERGVNPAVLSVTGGRMVFVTRSEGGVSHDSELRCYNALFCYLSHSAVVIRCESAHTLRTREKGGDESDPPQTGGACDLG